MNSDDLFCFELHRFSIEMILIGYDICFTGIELWSDQIRSKYLEISYPSSYSSLPNIARPSELEIRYTCLDEIVCDK